MSDKVSRWGDPKAIEVAHRILDHCDLTGQHTFLAPGIAFELGLDIDDVLRAMDWMEQAGHGHKFLSPDR